MPSSAPPSDTAPPAVEDQHDEPDTAIAPDADASDTSPAPDADEAPAAEGEAAPALSAEDLSELIAAYPDQFQEAITKAAAEAAPKEQATPTALTPRPNPLRESVGQAGREASLRMQDVTRRFNAGELDALPDAFMADIEAFGSWTNAEAEGRQLDLAERLFERQLGIDAGKLDDADPLQARYGDALDKRAAEHLNAFREFNKIYRETDPQQRAAILARAEQRQATATAAFLLERDALLVEHGKKLGAAETEKAAGKRIAAGIEKAGKNGHTEAIAKAQADLNARRATATAGNATQSAATGPLTIEEATTLPIEELIRRSKAQEGK